MHRFVRALDKYVLAVKKVLFIEHSDEKIIKPGQVGSVSKQLVFQEYALMGTIIHT